MRCLQLPYHFDPARLVADLALVAPAEWIPHMNRHHYDGRWSAAALRSIGGTAENINPDSPDLGAFRDTALLARCPYFREVLATFRCPLMAVRLLRLHIGSNIAEHIDGALDFEDGEVRLHIPIVTSEGVKFILDGARLVMAPGECWYTNVNLPHAVVNAGAVDRTHLVIDCRVDDWLRGVFASVPPPAPIHYAARLRLPAGFAAGALPGVFSAFAAARHGPDRPVRFRAEGVSLIVVWRGTHTWQLRLRTLPAPSSATDMIAELESSPDPDRAHRADYRALLDHLAAALPGVAIAEHGLS